MTAGAPTLLSLSGPADHMAEGKGTSLSASVGKRWRFTESKQIQPGLLKKIALLDSGATAGKDGQDMASSVSTEQKQGTLIELPCLQKRPGDIQAQKRKPEDPEVCLGTEQLPSGLPRASVDSTVCSVWRGTAQNEQRSAFSKPAKRPAETPRCSPMLLAGNAEGPWELSGLITTMDIPGWAQLSTFKLMGDFWRLHMLSQNILLCNAFQGSATSWLDHTQVQVPTSSTSSASASRALLPPTLSSPGLSTQNWCAKCNLAFRLTADLVLHMRSHHKREHVGPDPHCKKRREEVLTCPICHEYFRERHHLSRHMTSHS
ncbi:zinc finger protein 488 [Phodopus roborovskii]|uniref:Zfp488 protein n=1 Tax=Phodopus roborovskii TaxID=109678 RepID=A0AAV0A4T0_PHORO|nr:zinc finger protein 488 [Phodopus roborovskii]CAH7128223.1 Zfp488 [Phodopus roborovskii]